MRFYQTLGLVFWPSWVIKRRWLPLLAASFGRPLAVFAGAMAAMFLNHALAVFLGSRFFSRINPQLLKKGTAYLFMVIGLAIIIFSILNPE